jgi:hypothetical protein
MGRTAAEESVEDCPIEIMKGEERERQNEGR